MRILIGIAIGILIVGFYPSVGQETRAWLNTVFSEAERATGPTVEDALNKMVDKYRE